MFGLRTKPREPRPAQWSTDPPPKNVVLIVGQLARQFMGGDQRPIQFPPEVAFAWVMEDGGWINYLTGYPLTYRPDMWIRLPDMPPPPRPPIGGDMPRAQKGAAGL